MKKFRNRIALVALGLILIQLVIFDYSDVTWEANRGTYIGLISMVGVIVSMILSNRHDEKKEARK